MNEQENDLDFEVDPVNEKSKVCLHCQLDLPLSGYYKRTLSKSGYEAICKICHNIQKEERAKNRAADLPKKQRQYIKQTAEERAVSLDALKAYQKSYHKNKNHLKSLKHKEEKLKRILETYGSIDAYEEFKRVRQAASCKAWRAAKKLEKEQAKQPTPLRIFDCFEVEPSETN